MNANNLPQKEPLTHREKEILQLLAHGMSTKQIAGHLAISEYTVSNHRKNMLHKSGARSSAELVFLAVNYFQNGNSHL